MDGKWRSVRKDRQRYHWPLEAQLENSGNRIGHQLPKCSLPKLRVLTRDEQSALISAAKTEDDTEGLGVLISLFTGIRIGELCSLKWSDVSFDDGVLKINKTLQRIEKLWSCKG